MLTQGEQPRPVEEPRAAQDHLGVAILAGAALFVQLNARLASHGGRS